MEIFPWWNTETFLRASPLQRVDKAEQQECSLHHLERKVVPRHFSLINIFVQFVTIDPNNYIERALEIIANTKVIYIYIEKIIHEKGFKTL